MLRKKWEHFGSLTGGDVGDAFAVQQDLSRIGNLAERCVQKRAFSRPVSAQKRGDAIAQLKVDVRKDWLFAAIL